MAERVVLNRLEGGRLLVDPDRVAGALRGPDGRSYLVLADGSQVHITESPIEAVKVVKTLRHVFGGAEDPNGAVNMDLMSFAAEQPDGSTVIVLPGGTPVQVGQTPFEAFGHALASFDAQRAGREPPPPPEGVTPGGVSKNIPRP